MIFTAPLLLLALLALPALYFLLRATPPAPLTQRFPAVSLLLGLKRTEETPARTPWWLLLLRLVAAGLIVIGLAGPVLTASRAPLGAAGPVLLVVDNGWAAGPGWAARMAAAEGVLGRAERGRRAVALLTTAPGPAGEAPSAQAPRAAGLVRSMLAALRPMPWPTDRHAALAALSKVPEGPVFYVADGVAGADDRGFAQALASHGPVTILAPAAPAPLLSVRAAPGGLVARVRVPASRVGRQMQVLAETGDGTLIGPTAVSIAPGAREGEANVALPQELRNQLSALRLAGLPGAGSVALLDESARRRPVGMMGGGGADAPLLGSLYYVERALAPTAELRHGTIGALLARPLSMLVLADRPLAGPEAARVGAWVEQGGLLVRFAGPALAAAPDGLLPVRLLEGDRALGGAMSWSRPVALAPFPRGPFAGLPVPAEVTVSRQVLADPASVAAAEVWARLRDGTPLVTAARRGRGEIVLFSVTANADWSNLPLSGLFVSMLDRLVSRSAGIEAVSPSQRMAPAQVLDGEGVLGEPNPAAVGFIAGAIGQVAISPLHPPGFYGPAHDRVALNLGDRIVPAAMEAVPGAVVEGLAQAPRDVRLGPAAVALAVALLLGDFLATLGIAGLLRPVAVSLLLLAAAGGARAEESPALATHIAYVLTGDPEVDRISKLGLEGLGDYVNDRTAAVLAAPAPVVPGRDDLSFYPLLYWPVTANATLSPSGVAALNDYMRHGGVILIDTESGGGSFAPGADAALKRVSEGLQIPALAPLTGQHVLAHAFYLLSDFPGRYDGATVWIAKDQDRSNDDVSPVIIGSNDWAAAWAEDEDGRPLFATIPGGQRQRVLAFRFGVNLVMYALTGNYKGDQVHVPAILERLGQ